MFGPASGPPRPGLIHEDQGEERLVATRDERVWTAATAPRHEDDPRGGGRTLALLLLVIGVAIAVGLLVSREDPIRPEPAGPRSSAGR